MLINKTHTHNNEQTQLNTGTLSAKSAKKKGPFALLRKGKQKISKSLLKYNCIRIHQNTDITPNPTPNNKETKTHSSEIAKDNSEVCKPTNNKETTKSPIKQMLDGRMDVVASFLPCSLEPKDLKTLNAIGELAGPESLKKYFDVMQENHGVKKNITLARSLGNIANLTSGTKEALNRHVRDNIIPGLKDIKLNTLDFYMLSELSDLKEMDDNNKNEINDFLSHHAIPNFSLTNEKDKVNVSTVWLTMIASGGLTNAETKEALTNFATKKLLPNLLENLVNSDLLTGEISIKFCMSLLKTFDEKVKSAFNEQLITAKVIDNLNPEMASKFKNSLYKFLEPEVQARFGTKFTNENLNVNLGQEQY